MTGMSALDALGKSPFDLLEEHASLCLDTVKTLEKHLLRADQVDVTIQSGHDAVVAKEELADDLKRRLRRKIHQDLYLPIGRRAF